MSNKKFSKQHEWVSVEGDVATIGITKHATEMLGDIVFVELPKKGKNIKKEEFLVKLLKAINQLLTILQKLILIQKMKDGFLN